MNLSRVERIEWLVTNLEEISKSYFISKAIHERTQILDLGFEVFAPYRHLCNVLVADVVIRWCKVFGADNEEMHWKKLIDVANVSAFRAGFLSSAKISKEEYSAYWCQMKEVRDSVCAHFNYDYIGKEVPHFEKAIDCASAAHSYFVEVLIELGVERPKFDLKQFGLRSSLGFLEKVTGRDTNNRDE